MLTRGRNDPKTDLGLLAIIPTPRHPRAAQGPINRKPLLATYLATRIHDPRTENPMLTIRITVDKKGLDRLRQLGKGKVKQTLSGIVQVGGTLLFHNTLRRYDAAVDPDGAAWSPLRPSTLKRKGGRGKLLVESGGLRRSISKRQAGPLEARITARKDPPGGFHQSGTSRMVRRSFMGISSQDEQQVRQLALDHLRRLML